MFCSLGSPLGVWLRTGTWWEPGQQVWAALSVACKWPLKLFLKCACFVPLGLTHKTQGLFGTTKAAIKFVFPLEPGKWLFSVSVPGGLDVQHHVAVTATMEAGWSCLVFPVLLCAPWGASRPPLRNACLLSKVS